jgi:hypothetical protein
MFTAYATCARALANCRRSLGLRKSVGRNNAHAVEMGAAPLNQRKGDDTDRWISPGNHATVLAPGLNVAASLHRLPGTVALFLLREVTLQAHRGDKESSTHVFSHWLDVICSSRWAAWFTG